MRCFLAIDLPDPVREHLVRVQSAVRAEVPKASYPKPENLHITLKFLGEADERQIARLVDSLGRVKIDGALRLTPSGLAFFPPRRHARVIVATMTGSESLVAALHLTVEQRCRALGFASETRKYHPHVTFARSPRGVPHAVRQTLTESLASEWPGPEMSVTEFVLFESQLHPQGSRYIRLASFPVGRPPH
jgi:2'-5' RNA ligase